MPLLGGACKLGASAAPGGFPQFIGDPYVVQHFPLFPNDALAGIEVDADGGIEAYKFTGNQGDIGRWDGGASLDKADYQFRLDTITGNIDGGYATDVWLAAQPGFHNWDVLETGAGNEFFTGTLRVRLAISPFTEYDSASVSLYAESTP